MLKGQKASPETRARMSAAQKGRTFTPESLAKMSAAHIGKKHSPHHKARISAAMMGENHHYWKGDDITYRTAHERVWNRRGPAKSRNCVDCAGQADDWSYDHADLNELVDEQGLRYSTDPNHYQPRCKSCHKAFDQCLG